MLDKLDSGLKRTAAMVVAITTIIGGILGILELFSQRGQDDVKPSSTVPGPDIEQFCWDWEQVQRTISIISSAQNTPTSAVPAVLSRGNNEVVVLADRTAQDPPAEVREQAQDFARWARQINELLASVGYRLELFTPEQFEAYRQLSARANAAAIELELYYRSNC